MLLAKEWDITLVDWQPDWPVIFVIVLAVLAVLVLVAILWFKPGHNRPQR
jgi:uncharacterized integral membrane protein